MPNYLGTPTTTGSVSGITSDPASTTLTANDTLINDSNLILGNGVETEPTSSISWQYDEGSGIRYAGLGRNPTNNEFYLYDNVTGPIDNSTDLTLLTPATLNANFASAPVETNAIINNITAESGEDLTIKNFANDVSIKLNDTTKEINLVGPVTLSSTLGGRDIATDGTNQDNHIADVSDPHNTLPGMSVTEDVGNTIIRLLPDVESYEMEVNGIKVSKDGAKVVMSPIVATDVLDFANATGTSYCRFNDNANCNFYSEKIMVFQSPNNVTADALMRFKINGTHASSLLIQNNETLVQYLKINTTSGLITIDNADVDIKTNLDVTGNLQKGGVDASLVGHSHVSTDISDFDTEVSNNTTVANHTTHVADATLHRVINDAGTTTTELFSASKIISDLSGKSNTGHSHVATDITDFDTEVSNNTSVASNTTHAGLTNNPHTVTQAQVGLSNVTNESKATMFDNPTFTNTVIADHIHAPSGSSIVLGNDFWHSGIGPYSYLEIQDGGDVNLNASGADIMLTSANVDFQSDIKLSATTDILQSTGLKGHLLLEKVDNTNLVCAGAGVLLTTGASGNILIGTDTGADISLGDNNTCIGYQCNILNNNNDNTFIGFRTGMNAGTSGNSVIIGAYSGTTVNANNVCIGTNAFPSATGAENTGAGFNCGPNITTASESVYIGTRGGTTHSTGSGCVFVGHDSSSSADNTGSTMLGKLTTTNSDYSVSLGYEATCTKPNQLIFGSTVLSARAITEISPGFTNITSLGSLTNKYLNLYCSNILSNSDIVIDADGSTITLSDGGANSMTIDNGFQFVGDITVDNGSGLKSYMMKEVVDNTNMILGTAGSALTTGATKNLLIGTNAGTAITNSDNNTIIGYDAGTTYTSNDSVIIGGSAGKSLTSPFGNVIIGVNANGAIASVGANNMTAIGYNCMINGNVTAAAIDNCYVGAYSGRFLTSGSKNACFGTWSGKNITSGIGNTAIGWESLIGNTTGSYNLGLGWNTSVSAISNYQISLGAGATCDKSSQMTIGASTTQIITEIRPGTTDSSCNLGSTSNQFGSLWSDQIINNSTINITSNTQTVVDFADNGISLYQPMRSQNGSATTASYSFLSSTDSGMWSPATDQVGILCNGTNVVTFKETNVALTQPIRCEDGSLTEASYGFTSSVDSGVYSPSTDQVGILCNGKNVITFKENGAYKPVSALKVADPNPLNDEISQFTTFGGAYNCTLPDATANAGRTFHICLQIGGNNLTITPAGSDTIGLLAPTFVLSTSGSSVKITAVGTNWYVV